jgi:hypothetical protein
MDFGSLLSSVGVTSWPRRARPLFDKQHRHAALFILTAFHPTAFTPALWFSVEQPVSTAASSFFRLQRRGKCHGKNSHFQEFTSGHQTCHYRRQILAIGGLSFEADKQARLPDP